MARDRVCVLQFISVAVCLWALQIQTQSVMADYVLEIKVTSYSNPTSRCAGCSSNYPCCDRHSATVCARDFQYERCDNQLYYCLRPHNTLPTIRGCTGYEHTVTSDVNWNDAPINFSQPTVLGLPNPMNLTGLDTFWRGVQLYIEVLDYDIQRYKRDEFVDSFSINMNENTRKESYLPQADKSSRHNLATISLTARFLCAENCYGELCEKFDNCSAPQTSCSEHGVCSNIIAGNGYTCDCESGYTGTDCETDIDYCDGVNCSGRGQCMERGNTYSCLCEPGYTGTDCDTDINECLLSGSKCSGHGRCIDGTNSFTCDCEPGYTGTYCKTDINECLLSESECSGHGRCIDGTNFFTCDCEPGYTGTDCETDIDYCDGVNCSGRGQCMERGNTYSCLCEPGYTGTDCETDINECLLSGSKCSGHGRCTDGTNSFTCDCEPGYTGTYCKTDINECLLSESEYSGHGRCIDGTNFFTCDCEPGYTGTDCEIDIDYCDGVNCSGRGQCVEGGNTYSCLCEPGYTGTDCETDIDYCDGVNCSRRGQCIERGNTYSCLCEPGYTGTDCETDINECMLTEPECSGRGSCTDGVNSFTCVCDKGFTGLLCETNIDECAGVNCSGRGQCVDGVNNFTCVCQSGYTGDNCTVDVQGGAGGSSGGIIGGVVGGLVAVILTVLLLVLLVVLVMVAVRKRQVQVTQGIIQAPPPPYTPGDNPVYGAQDTVIIKLSDKSNAAELDNPLYDIEGPEYETPITTRQPTTYETIPPLYSTVTGEHTEQSTHKDVSDTDSNTVEFDNPIYGDNDIEGPEYATPNTTRRTTTYEVPIPLYSTVTDDVWRCPQT